MDNACSAAVDPIAVLAPGLMANGVDINVRRGHRIGKRAQNCRDVI